MTDRYDRDQARLILHGIDAVNLWIQSADPYVFNVEIVEDFYNEIVVPDMGRPKYRYIYRGLTTYRSDNDMLPVDIVNSLLANDLYLEKEEDNEGDTYFDSWSRGRKIAERFMGRTDSDVLASFLLRLENPKDVLCDLGHIQKWIDRRRDDIQEAIDTMTSSFNVDSMADFGFEKEVMLHASSCCRIDEIYHMNIVPSDDEFRAVIGAFRNAGWRVRRRGGLAVPGSALLVVDAGKRAIHVDDGR